jgi:RNAse (barnase) inhibitor barstar
MDDLIAALEGDRPPGLYRLNRNVQVDELAGLAREHDWRFFYVDGRAIHNKTDFFRVCAISLRFPDYFGQNWDAFEDCLRDLEETSAKQYILLFDQPDQFVQENPEEWAIALNIFYETVEFWQDTDTPMYILFQTTRPALDGLDELLEI